jgi:hypothetical protein
MRYSFMFTKLFAIMLFCALTALGQVPDKLKHFSKDGLAFDYENGWTLNDQSGPDSQQLILGRSDSDAQVKVTAYRNKIDTPEKLAQARTKLVDPYIASFVNSFTQMGAKPTRSPATIQVGTVQAEGVRIAATLDGVPGEAAIYWVNTGNRVVVLTFFGPDQALKKASTLWETVRGSLRVGDTAPTPAPAPK